MNANYILNEQLSKFNSYIEKIKKEGAQGYNRGSSGFNIFKNSNHEEILKENNEKLRVTINILLILVIRRGVKNKRLDYQKTKLSIKGCDYFKC